jgi:hypothetical protein
LENNVSRILRETGIALGLVLAGLLILSLFLIPNVEKVLDGKLFFGVMGMGLLLCYSSLHSFWRMFFPSPNQETTNESHTVAFDTPTDDQGVK